MSRSAALGDYSLLNSFYHVLRALSETEVHEVLALGYLFQSIIGFDRNGAVVGNEMMRFALLTFDCLDVDLIQARRGLVIWDASLSGWASAYPTSLQQASRSFSPIVAEEGAAMATRPT